MESDTGRRLVACRIDQIRSRLGLGTADGQVRLAEMVPEAPTVIG